MCAPLIWLSAGAPIELIRDVLRVTRLQLIRNQRHVLKVHTTDLIAGWGHYGPNRGRILLDTRLLFDASYGHPSC
jgi:hypothetical protein